MTAFENFSSIERREFQEASDKYWRERRMDRLLAEWEAAKWDCVLFVSSLCQDAARRREPRKTSPSPQASALAILRRMAHLRQEHEP